MRRLKQSRAFALMTTAAMLMSSAALPAMSVSAEDEVKKATLTLTDNWTGELDFKDLAPEFKTTQVNLAQSFSGTIDFSDVDTENGEFRPLYDDNTKSGSWNFSVSDSEAAIIAAIEAKTGDDLTEASIIKVTGISTDFDCALNSSASKEFTIFSGLGGNTSSGSWSDANKEEGFTYTTNDDGTYSGTISDSDFTSDIADYASAWAGVGIWSNNASDTFTLNVTGVTLDISYAVEGVTGAYKSLYDNAASGAWSFSMHDTKSGKPADRTDDILAALKAETGDETADYAVKITDIAVDYSWEYTTTKEDKDVSIELYPSVYGFASLTDDKNWVDTPDYSNEDGSQNIEPFKLTSKTGSGTIKCSDVIAKGGETVADYYGFCINVGLWTDNPNDKLTFNVTGITLDVQYTVADVPVTEYLAYEDIGDAKYVDLSYGIKKKTECGHDVKHIGDDGKEYFESYTYCPWSVIEIHKVYKNGEWSENAYWVNNSVGCDLAVGTATVLLSDITAEVGSLSSGEKLVFTGYSAEYIKYNLISSKTDVQLETGSITTTKIEEQNDWDPVLGNVPNGKPEIKPTIQIANNPSIQSFNGYSAIKIDYTLGNPSECSGLIVVLHGWEDNSVGWMEKFYPANGTSGSIVIDLSEMQDKTYHNIFVGPVAKTTAKIGDSFAPNFTVTDAKILTSYSGDFSTEIDPIEPAEPVKPVEPVIPTPPSQPSQPTQPTLPTTPADDKTTSTDNTDKKDNNAVVNVAVENAVTKAKENSTVKIEIKTEATKITAEVFLEAKDKNVKLEIKLDNGVKWEIEASEITDKAADVNINVDINTKNIPTKKVENISRGNDSMQISLSHNGSFGFNANLSIPVDKKYNGKTANLFHYKDDGSFDFIGSSNVKGGAAKLPFKHASEYVIIFSDEAMYEDVSAAAGIYTDDSKLEASSNSVDAKVIVCGVSIVVIAAAGFAVSRKLRQK
ncbi:MAG: hypothetical protein J6C96_03510 [Oscillospiraceae bacterium]|nr:hypothetical protein [Oscillospiraceae bacterium]